MEELKIKKLSVENIADEHICCAFSDKKCIEGYEAKKVWLKNQFNDGYVFKKLNVRGKVFIEYVPAEKAWLPIVAPDYMLINCFWVSGKYKGQGHAKELFQECVEDSKNMNGIVAVAGTKKQPFLSEKKFFQKQGFELCDKAEPYFELWYKPNQKNATVPKFKDCAKKAECDIKEGLSVYYTNACPFTEYYVNVELKEIAKKRGIKLKIVKLKTREQAQNHFVPHSIYSVFNNGKFVTQHILNEKYFEKFVK
ncbi:MAG: GNAT family N-acetyltransferase [Bacteroidetes bacterium]|jgi:N-acetylglutamate synthase-like GNAT family acetyltransferase|nr:GNAT family N-acetyltransferase [Bacteroidota bacterium]MBT6685423.1 GNAT family N-acetyltransferase [Bacteroidota bacterium]MBT7144219.1 GNAT family N-acetyltransferase [Bacteroidota bacterium]MBT7492149.1 GNAT family N-acetyltransferase [Bacteroidota bacterium]